MSGRGIGERTGKSAGLAIVGLAYVTAVGAAWVVADILGYRRPLWALGLGYLAAALVIYAWSMELDNGSMFDAWWSVLPSLAAVWLAVAATHATMATGIRRDHRRSAMINTSSPNPKTNVSQVTPYNTPAIGAPQRQPAD